MYAAIDAGHGTVVLSNDLRLQQETWYNVKFTKSRGDVSLSVDSTGETVAKLPGRLYGLNILGPLYLGGYPDLAILEVCVDLHQPALEVPALCCLVMGYVQGI